MKCNVCEKEFIKTTHNKVYCTEFCRQKRWRNDNKEFDSKRKMTWARKNKDRFNEIGRNFRQRLRKEILKKYGDKCACCGESAYEFLAIDHINGGGNKHRREISPKNCTSTSIYQWLKRNNFPDGFQILCHNCNMAKSLYKMCPHRKAIQFGKQTLEVKI